MNTPHRELRRVVALLVGLLCWFGTAANAAEARKPNIIFLLADDLGYGDIGAYGQKKIRTPNLDRLAADGMRFTQHYSGHNVCAPSRCVLMSGMHPGHAYIRDNRGGVGQKEGGGKEGQEPVLAGMLKLPLTLQKLGYTAGAFGKWGLGAVGSSGDPLKQGFARFFGFNDQAVAHNYYVKRLWSDSAQVELNNPEIGMKQRKLAETADPKKEESYAMFRGQTYAPDLISEEARKFLKENRERPFFLFYPTTVPHLALQVPEDSLAEYKDAFPEEPYLGGRGYLPNRTPRATYAAMITRMDREIGRLLKMVDEYGLREQTIVIFASDNGPLYGGLGGTDSEFFDSTAGLRGRKGSYYEGGFRVPCLVRWSGKIAPGSQSDRVVGFEDWLPTLLELIGAKEATPAGIDGISFAPTLFGKTQPERPYLYRESPGYGGQQAVRVGNWKLVRTGLHAPNPKKALSPTLELFNLAEDRAEKRNVAEAHPEVVARLQAIAREQHVPTKLWPNRTLDAEAKP